MAQFDLYWNSDQQTKRAYPLLLDVQTNLLEHLTSRMVIPLTPVTQNSGPINKGGNNWAGLICAMLTGVGELF